MDELKHCPFCGSDSVKLSFKRRYRCSPKKVMGGGYVMKYSFQVLCMSCHSFGPGVQTPYVPELDSTEEIPAHLQEYADKAVAGWNNRVDNRQRTQEDESTIRLLDYTSMRIGAVYSYQDLLFYWDGESLMYGDEGLDIKDWAELKESDFLFQKYMNKKLSRLSS